jgi:hypothetical protein
MPQQTEAKGPYVRITCSGCSSHTFLVPVLPGEQWYKCAQCFYCTVVRITDTGAMYVSGRQTDDSRELMQMKMKALSKNSFPMFPPPPQGLDDLLNSLG